MICSDGVTDDVPESDFKEIIMEHKQDESLLECCDLIYKKAIERGSKDNISIILLRKEDKTIERGEDTYDATVK